MTFEPSYLESLPKKRMGAGCLFFDEHGRVLLVKPSYKPVWEIPGGIVELEESPKQCCHREVREEIGLEKEVGNLLIVDYNSKTTAKSESLMFIFNGGTLSADDITRIRLQPDELIDYGFFTEDALPVEMTASLRNRVLAAWQRTSTSGGVYLENQLTV